LAFPVGWVGELPEATADKGAARLFFIRENREVTSVYEDWSFSSSSEKGLKEVKLARSSSFVVLLRDRFDDEGPLVVVWTGE
jgi:hypothetical protein